MHEEASSTAASSSTTPSSSSSKNIIYGSAPFHGNLLITTSQLPDPNSSSLYELIHQPAAPMNHHHNLHHHNPMTTSKLILSNNSLISTTTAPNPLVEDEFNVVASSADLHELAAAANLDDSTSDAVAAAAALIDLHPSSSSAAAVIPELATATSSSGSGCSSLEEAVGPLEPIEIKIPGSGAVAAATSADDGSSYAEGSSDAVRADRMRGGRNKFGPMYKRDRARKLQIMRQRQLAIQALRGSIGGGVGIGQLGTAADGSSPAAAAAAAAAGLQGLDYHQSPYSSMHIKQEIQIPQVSSLTSSPDSSPSPIAIALGQVNPQTTISLSSGVGGNGSSGGGGSSGGVGGGGGTGGGAGNGGAGSGGAGTNGGSNSTSTAIQSQLSESKLWMSANSTTASPHSLSPKTFSFDSGTNPTSTADNPADTLRVSPMIRDFVQSIDGDDREWTASLFSLLQNQSYNQCEVDLFELMCKVLDQNLFSQVDWARNTIFFKDLKVDDQMKLLQNSWSDMLVLDHIHQRLHNALPDDTTLHNGQKFDLLGLGLLGVPSLAEHFNELQNKLQELKFDVGDYICMKFLLLLNPGKGADVRGITNRKTVIEGYENVQAALLDYTLTCYPSVPDKFAKLLSIIPEIHVIASRGEEHLYIKHCAGSAPSQTLLMEMLHAKRK
ncbi:nuclear hormone receptor FTZ-F1 isoform X3 [Culex pipiens pallens]|uniref:nuclear hormone receptor FTZ-F1 isoform X3 n=1 Tax=Culex pipiens pallens TaxID=42434 RepID=UPI0019548E69|nr:nuclear hormone receptor FTZ-F1 isoform X3 [Culex pipiens pallens]